MPKLLLLAALALGLVPTAVAPAHPPEDGASSGMAIDRSRFMPDPLPLSHFAEWIQQFDLDSDQIDALEDVRIVYAARYEELRADEGAQIDALWPVAFRRNDRDGSLEPVYTPQHVELLDLRGRVLQTIESSEGVVFASLRAIADSADESVVKQMRDERQRELYDIEARITSAGIDLGELTETIEPTADERTMLDERLRRYQQERTRLIVERARRIAETERVRAELLVALGPEWRLVIEPEIVTEIDRQLDTMERDLATADEPLRDLNRDTLPRLAGVLLPDRYQELRDAYNERVMPAIREEDGALAALYEAAAGLPGLTLEHQQTLHDHLRTVRTRLGPLGLDAVEAYEPLTLMREDDGGDPISRIRLELDLLEVMTRRRGVRIEAAQLLAGTIGTEHAYFLETIEAYLAAAEATAAVDAYHANIYRQRIDQLAELARLPVDPVERLTVDNESDIDAGPESEGTIDDAEGGRP